MADNTLTGLIVTIYDALNTVAREQVGMIKAVRKWSFPGRKVAQNEPITYPIVPAFSAPSPISASNIIADPSGIVVGRDTMLMDQVNGISFGWNGEEATGLGNSGIFATTLEDAFKQAFRAHVNQIEASLTSLYVGASAAFGTPGTVPFATKDDLDATAETRQLLEDNGMWFDGKMKFVASNQTAKNLRRYQGIVFKYLERGDTVGQLKGDVAQLEGFDMFQTGFAPKHTNGTGANYTTNGSTAVNAVAVTVQSGSGTILSGDVVKFATDSRQYVAGSTGLAATTLSLNLPGILAAAIPTTTAITTIGNNTISGYTANLAFNEDAIVLISALPNLPEGGDQAVARTTVMDKISGLNFEVSEYKGFRKTIYLVAAAWGNKLVKPEGLVLSIY